MIKAQLQEHEQGFQIRALQRFLNKHSPYLDELLEVIAGVYLDEGLYILGIRPLACLDLREQCFFKR